MGETTTAEGLANQNLTENAATSRFCWHDDLNYFFHPTPSIGHRQITSFTPTRDFDFPILQGLAEVGNKPGYSFKNTLFRQQNRVRALNSTAGAKIQPIPRQLWLSLWNPASLNVVPASLSLGKAV
jgi:hypothetical protein